MTFLGQYGSTETLVPNAPALSSFTENLEASADFQREYANGNADAVSKGKVYDEIMAWPGWEKYHIQLHQPGTELDERSGLDIGSALTTEPQTYTEDDFYNDAAKLPQEAKGEFFQQFGYLPTKDDVAAIRKARVLRAKEIYGQVSDRSGIAGDFGGLVGSMAGALTDPVVTGSMLAAAPVAVEGIIPGILAEAGINAGTSAIQEAQSYGYRTRELGIPSEQAIDESLANVAANAAFGAVSAGVFRGAGRGLEALIGKARSAGLAQAAEQIEALKNWKTDPDKAISVIDARMKLNLTDDEKGRLAVLRDQIMLDKTDPAPADVKGDLSRADHAALIDEAGKAIETGEVSDALQKGSPYLRNNAEPVPGVVTVEDQRRPFVDLQADEPITEVRRDFETGATAETRTAYLLDQDGTARRRKVSTWKVRYAGFNDIWKDARGVVYRGKGTRASPMEPISKDELSNRIEIARQDLTDRRTREMRANESVFNAARERKAKYDALAQDIANQIADKGYNARVVIPQDDSTRFVYGELPNGTEYKVRISDKAEPKKASEKSDISIDPKSKKTGKDAILRFTEKAYTMPSFPKPGESLDANNVTIRPAPSRETVLTKEPSAEATDSEKLDAAKSLVEDESAMTIDIDDNTVKPIKDVFEDTDKLIEGYDNILACMGFGGK